MQGVLLHASPPMKHEPPFNYQGYEVTRYQPPWKTFSEFALHNDSDDCTHTPGFQHLVNQVGDFLSPRNWNPLIIFKSSSSSPCPFNSFMVTISAMKAWHRCIQNLIGRRIETALIRTRRVKKVSLDLCN